ncbi:fasciclin domain-containing protein [Spirosoma jeollabukense]
MKIKQHIGLFALGIALVITPGWAQTTPTSTAPATGYPQGAIAPDSTPAKTSRSQRRAMKRSQNAMNQNAATNTNTSTQDANYRQSSASEGTSINNSNTTNYNSNNVTNAPTGAGSNPNTLNSTTPSPSTGTPTNTKGEARSDAGAAEAISGAKTTESPAVKAGSTVRNTSIGDFVASSPNYTTLQNALQSVKLDETLRGTGPYTIFAPTNTAFKKLPATVQGGLLDGSNREALTQLLSYHVVNGALTADELTRQIKAGNGKAQLKTLAGGSLTAQLGANGQLQLTDEKGGMATIEGADNRQANGVVHGINSVLMPKSGSGSFR